MPRNDEWTYGDVWSHGGYDWFGMPGFGQAGGVPLTAKEVYAEVWGQFRVHNVTGEVQLQLWNGRVHLVKKYGSTFPYTIRIKPWNTWPAGGIGWNRDVFLEPARFDPDVGYWLIEGVATFSSEWGYEEKDFGFGIGWTSVGNRQDYLIGTSGGYAISQAVLGGTVHYQEWERGTGSPYAQFTNPFTITFNYRELPQDYYPGAICIDDTYKQVAFKGDNFKCYNESGSLLPTVNQVETGSAFKFKPVADTDWTISSIVDNLGNRYTPDAQGFVTVNNITSNMTIEIRTEQIRTPKAVFLNGNLTFYYDNQNHEGTVYPVPNITTKEEEPGWQEHSQEIENIIFDSSFLLYRPKSIKHWFGKWQTNVIPHSEYSWTYPKVTAIDFSYLNTIDLETIYDSLNGLINVEFLDLSGLVTNKNTIINSMIGNEAADTKYNMKVKKIKISGWDISNLTWSENVFANCTKLEKIYSDIDDLPDFKNVQSTSRMFINCTNIVGSAGTTYDSTKVDGAMGHKDSTSNPGYFSYIPPTNKKKRTKIKKKPVIIDSTQIGPHPSDMNGAYESCNELTRGAFIMDGGWRDIKNMTGDVTSTDSDDGFIYDNGYKKILKG